MTNAYAASANQLVLEDLDCNLCGGRSRIVIRPAVENAAPADLSTTFRSSSSERLTRQLVCCADCGLQYVSPRPKADVLIGGYADGTDEQFVSQVHGRERTFEKCLDLLERVWNRVPGRLLDIGAAGGSFPFVASLRGWKVDGCEPNRWLCEWARQHYGLSIRPGTVFDQDLASESFEVVTLWDVLEHTPDPRKEVQEVHRLLTDDGLLVVNYPDIGSWIARAMGRSWVFLLDVHLYYFTRATIRRLLEDAGFTVVCIRPHMQQLALGYVLQRAAPYVGAPARLLGRVAQRLGLEQWQVPYWMGQTLVIARKRRRESTRPAA